jgi:hypothetical protein
MFRGHVTTFTRGRPATGGKQVGGVRRSAGAGQASRAVHALTPGGACADV